MVIVSQTRAPNVYRCKRFVNEQWKIKRDFDFGLICHTTCPPVSADRAQWIECRSIGTRLSWCSWKRRGRGARHEQRRVVNFLCLSDLYCTCVHTIVCYGRREVPIGQRFHVRAPVNGDEFSSFRPDKMYTINSTFDLLS